jgi:methyl-accepting chemotaxis protein WspA
LIAADQKLEKLPYPSVQDLQVHEPPEQRPEELERKWNEFSRLALEGNRETNQMLYESLIDDLQALSVYVSDASNLLLDPDIDSNYMAETLVNSIPKTESIIPKITLLLQQTIENKFFDEKIRIELISLLTTLKNSLNDSKVYTEKVFNFEKKYKSNSESQNKLKDPFLNYIKSVEEFIQSIETNFLQTKEIPLKSQPFVFLSKKALQGSFNYWDIAIDDLERLLQTRLDNMKFQQQISVLITILSALAGFLIGMLIMLNISLPLTNLIKAAKNLAAGDLSVRVPISNKDEAGQVGLAFNQMAESFQGLIGQLQWTGIQLTTSTTEIAATAKQQESTIMEQEATTKEIAATAKEISTTAKDFAKTMSEVNRTAEQTSSLASSGKAGLTRMESIMRQMVDAAGNIASKLAVLNEKAGSITSIITTIAKVADQTNLLSLNAAIEAEKAGEYGRSFAVIAREIRRLADQTANATLDIEKMVNEMVSAVSAGVMGVDKFSEEINTGVKQASEVGEQLSKIIEQVQLQTQSFETVNQGMQAQSISAEQINGSINQLSEAAQQTTESIRQFHNAIEQLNNAAQEMQNAVTKIRR